MQSNVDANVYRLIDQAMLFERMKATDSAKFKADYIQAIAESLGRFEIHRQPVWTENIAVGSEDFVRAIAMQTTCRQRLAVTENPCGVWQVREAQEPYA